jgi:16S rRNA (cytidine1402-2'-O)-methyltransferase
VVSVLEETPRVPTLYVCATPIGNLSDVTHRLLDTLRLVDVVAAEDTRVTQKLLQRFGMSKRMVSVRQHNEKSGAATICGYLASGLSVAYVSDAGTPALCDPGQDLVGLVRDAGYAVVPIPGPSAVSTFLSVAGMPVDKWIFGGFFPRRVADAQPFFHAAQTLQLPVVFFESPMRIHESMSAILPVFPAYKVAFGRELTKCFETIWSGSPNDVLAKLGEYPKKGEWVFAVMPLPNETRPDLQSVVKKLHAAGLDKKQMLEVGKTCFGFSRNDLYQLIKDIE